MNERLREADIATGYYVDGRSPVVIRIGQHDASVRNHLANAQVEIAAFLTAWNPGSHPTAQEQNSAAQTRLASAVVALGCATITGRGIGQDKARPPRRKPPCPGHQLQECSAAGR